MNRFITDKVVNYEEASDFYSSFIYVRNFLMACSDDNNNNESKNVNTEENSSQNNNGVDVDNNNNDAQNDINNSNDNDEENDGSDEWGPDEMGLGIGDTGIVNNNFSSTEITLNSAELVEDEDANRGQYVVLDMTIKNIGDEPVKPSDVFGATELEPEGGATRELANYDEFIEEWLDEIDVDEEASGPIYFDAKDKDKYELFLNRFLDSQSNKISFKFSKDEID